MKFRVRDLPEERSFSLDEAFMRDVLSALAGQSSLDADQQVGAVAVTVAVAEEGGAVVARGQLSGWFHVACSRCLGPVRLTADEPFLLTFLPERAGEQRGELDELDGEDEAEVDHDDIDVASYDGKEVDLTHVLRDHVLLSVPYAPLCAESCKGLCARCGADLNQGQCACPPVTDPRWAGLAAIDLDESTE